MPDGGFPWVVVAYSFALYNYVLAAGFFVAPVQPDNLFVLFGILGTIAWIAGGLLSQVNG